MFLKDLHIAPARLSEILTAAEAAARRIPPAFPLDATVAVNPFLGQTDEDLATAAARLARVAGTAILPARTRVAARLADGTITDDMLADALASSPHAGELTLADLKTAATQTAPAPKALPTVAELATDLTHIDWPSVIARTVGLWAGGHFDRGQALWTPAPGQGAFAAWRAWASHDLTPELAGLSGFAAHVAASPDTAERAILRASDRLGLTAQTAEGVYHRLLIDLAGWAQHARWILWQAELAGDTDSTLTDLLAIRLLWEEALLDLQDGPTAVQLGEHWTATLAGHAAPLTPSRDQVIDAILQEAAERAHQAGLANALPGTPAAKPARPALQAAFCIDVRSEVFRRALERIDTGIETIGFAGFFGLPLSHQQAGSDLVETHLPVLLNPGMAARADITPDADQVLRIGARASRAWSRFSRAAVSSFAFVEAAGPLYVGKLIRDAMGLPPEAATAPKPVLSQDLSAEDKAATAATVLKAMSMHDNHARVVLLLGHGATVTNTPHQSAYQCGACGGQSGEVSARLLAQLLNDPDARAGLPAHGLTLAPDTIFVAGLHDTTTDKITLYDLDDLSSHADDLKQARRWLADAGVLARTERATRLPRGTADTLTARAHDWAETRPEWGLAGCAAFIAAPRAATHGADLGGRAFLHSYDWQADQGFGVLELILTAPVVVASWISLQYYGSSVAPDLFGSGNKLLHNVSGGIGVVEGNGGRLRAGLPLQAVHDGADLAHDPLRLTIFLEAPTAAIDDVLAKHPGVQALFDNGWLHMIVLKDGRASERYRPGRTWQTLATSEALAA